MNQTLLPIRIVFVALCAAAGWLVCYASPDWDAFRARGLFIGLSIGVPDPKGASGIKPRLPQGVVVHREQYDPTLDPATIAAYDSRMSAFQTEQRMPDERWTQRVIQRVKTPASLSGRHRMKEALANLGFELK
jgi:hypothetical protein